MSCEHVRDPALQEYYEANPHLTCARCWSAGVRPVWSDGLAQQYLSETIEAIAEAYRQHQCQELIGDPVFAVLEEAVCRMYRRKDVRDFVLAVDALRAYAFERLGVDLSVAAPGGQLELETVLL